ncbi:MAG TPA: DUF3857 domain-containing protein [Anaeromyxobacter sp.]|nr:DUF3857 domain-containing protein [Anaeromyxobacter sp.]
MPRPFPRPLLALFALLLAPPSRAAPGNLPAPGPGAVDPVAGRLSSAIAALDRDRRGPEGIADLGALASLEDELPDLGRLAAVYERVAGDAAALPEVRSLALFQLASLERTRGNVLRAQNLLRRLGFVSGFVVVGPFDDEGKRGLATAFPPEDAVDLGARYPGKVREVGWRPLPRDAAAFGFVHLGATLRPTHQVVAYALASVVAPREERVQLWFGGSGAARVFVNGALAVEDLGYHLARPDQRGASVTLRKGANRILVKLCHQSGEMGFYLRLADAHGDGLALAAGDPAAPMPAAGSPPSHLEDAVEALSGKVAADDRDAAAHAALSAVLVVRASGDREERRAAAEAGRAAALSPRSVEAQLAAAELEDEHAARRVILDAAERAAPGDARVLRALAAEELEQNRPQAAARLLERAVGAAPGWASARTALSEALERSGLAARAALLALDTARLFPTSPPAVAAAAHAAARLGRVDEAVARERTLLGLRFDDVRARGSLAAHLLDKGDLDGAVALLSEGLRLAPDDLSLRLRLADLLAANGRTDAAEEAYARALELCPEDADAWERRGRSRLAAGRTSEAKADLDRALALRPQDQGLKELVRSLTPEEERFWKPYLLDPKALAAAAPAPLADEDAIVLGELQVTRVLPSGLSSHFTQRVVKVLTTRGADAFRRQSTAWSPDRQEVQLERAQVLKPDGKVVESHDDGIQSASEPWYRLYYDLLVRTLSFPALAAGDVVEVAWRVDDTASENLLSDYFGDLAFLDEPTRKLRFDYVLLAPESRTIHANLPAGVDRTVRSLPGGVREYRYRAKDLPRLTPEPGMPGWSEVARYLHLSTYDTWDQVNQFYWRLVRDQLRPTPEIRAAAEKLTDGVREAERGAPPTSEREHRAALVRAAYDFVVTQTRYVGLEFGIHGYKPYRVDQILSRRFGDCKDKASLLHALLEAMGVDSRLVLLRMRRLGRLPEQPASLAIFNHAILYVPELDQWLDGTAAYSGTRDLPGEDRGATVLVVNPDGPPRFGTLPEAQPGDNRVEADLDLALSRDGSAAVRGAWKVCGTDAPAFRRSYAVEDGRESLLEQSLSRLFPGSHVESMKTSDLTRIEEDVGIGFELAVPRCAQADGDGLRFPPFGAAPGYVETYAALSTRRLDLDVGGPRDTRFRYRYTLPPGWKAVELPDATQAEGPLGGFAVRYREEDGALVAEGHVRLAGGRVTPADYPAFRELLGEVDRAFARRIRVAPAQRKEAP